MTPQYDSRNDARTPVVVPMIVVDSEPLPVEHGEANARFATSDDGMDRAAIDLDRPRLGFTQKYRASSAGRLQRIQRHILRGVVGEALTHSEGFQAGGSCPGVGVARSP